MDGCGAGAVSKAGAARRQPKAAAAAARCRCPQKRKKMGTGVLLDVPLDFIPGSYQVLLYFALASPRFMSRFTIHTSGKVRKGDARLLPNWMKLMVVDLLPEPAGYSRTGERGIFPCSIGWVFFARVDIQGTLHHTLAGKI